MMKARTMSRSASKAAEAEHASACRASISPRGPADRCPNKTSASQATNRKVSSSAEARLARHEPIPERTSSSCKTSCTRRKRAQPRSPSIALASRPACCSSSPRACAIATSYCRNTCTSLPCTIAVATSAETADPGSRQPSRAFGPVDSRSITSSCSGGRPGRRSRRHMTLIKPARGAVASRRDGRVSLRRPPIPSPLLSTTPLATAWQMSERLHHAAGSRSADQCGTIKTISVSLSHPHKVAHTRTRPSPAAVPSSARRPLTTPIRHIKAATRTPRTSRSAFDAKPSKCSSCDRTRSIPTWPPCQACASAPQVIANAASAGNPKAGEAGSETMAGKAIRSNSADCHRHGPSQRISSSRSNAFSAAAIATSAPVLTSAEGLRRTSG